MNALQPRVHSTVQRLSGGTGTLLVAVSGGADSVALLRLLAGSMPLEVAHFDHALREASAADAVFVARLADSLGLPFHSERVEVESVARAKGWNLEDAARRLRYSFLTRVAKRVGADVVATGHTLDDQAETVLMQLLRGAAYLTGMKTVRGKVIRPLLEIPKHTLLSYLEQLGQPYCEDATNRDRSRTRAWLRHDLLPLLEVRYPAVKQGLARLATLQQDQQTALQEQGRGLVRAGKLEVAALRGADRAVQRAALVHLLRGKGAPVTFEALEGLLRGLEADTPTRVSLSDSLSARVAYGQVDVVGPVSQPPSVNPVQGANELPREIWPDLLRQYPDLLYRGRLPGDRIHLPGGTKKLSDLLIDRKVPREERDGLRVLASGARVFWVEGVALDPAYALREEDPDETLMRLALEQAEVARDAGELPVGAVVVRNGKVIAAAHNETETQRDPTAHAEVLALRRAAEVLGDWRLMGCTLYVTLEPCPMCFGAMLQAHLPRVVYGAENRREGALGTVTDLRAAGWKRPLEVRGGVLAGASSELLTTFFSTRRRNDQS